MLHLCLLCFFSFRVVKQVSLSVSFKRFPKDVQTYGIDRQFLWGKSLLVTPVLDPGVDYVVGYFPEGVWYDYFTVRYTLLSKYSARLKAKKTDTSVGFELCLPRVVFCCAGRLCA